jgi:hypothetical protein
MCGILSATPTSLHAGIRSCMNSSTAFTSSSKISSIACLLWKSKANHYRALDSAEIECFLVDDNMARIEWSNLVGGIKLCVKQEDAEAALDMLEQPIPEEFDVDGVGP